MSMHDELAILARSRSAEIQHGLDHRPPSLEPARPQAPWISWLLARVLCRMGARMVAIGRRLECYEMRLLRQT